MQEQLLSEENVNGTRFSWNVLPSNKADLAKMAVPLGFHYTPNKILENGFVNYDPVLCKTCKSALNSQFTIDYRLKTFDCSFCSTRNSFPTLYAQSISEQNLPAELLPEYSTIEYKLNKKESNWPVFIFIIDIAVEEDELVELKESIQQTLSTLPEECGIGVITFGTMCQVHEIGFADFPLSYVFKGEKQYLPKDIQEQLGILTNKAQNLRRFILPVKECDYAINTFFDELQVDPWLKKTGERHSRCSGLALNVAISMMDSLCFGEPGRILLFLGGAPSIGEGQIVGKLLAETIRNYVDFEKGNPNTKYFKPAVQYYENLAATAARAGHVIDVFSCSLNQVGLYEMKCLVEKTGGIMILTDSFSTMPFKYSIKKMFELDENGFLKMNFKGKSSLFLSNHLRVSGAIGHMLSLNIGANMVSTENLIGEANTREWHLGGMDSNSTYSYYLDINPSPQGNTKYAVIQIQTTYISSDRSTRMRVTTIKKKISGDVTNTSFKNELAVGFDQDAAAVLMARYCVNKGYKEEYSEVLRWLDKTLIKIISLFASYRINDVKSFKLMNEFNFFPQFMFYLRRSHFIQNFNASPDEVTYYKTILYHENVTNSTIMIQPTLFSYTSDNSEATPVYLDIDSMKNDHVLVLDAFFFVVVWHGEEVCRWRDADYHNMEGYENIKSMLENPQEYASALLNERLPVPRFVSCDSGSGQERLVKCTVNPSSSSGNSKVMQDGYVSDDVSLKVFMDHLIRLSIQG